MLIVWLIAAFMWVISPAQAACSTTDGLSSGCDLGITITNAADIATRRGQLINVAYGIGTGVLPTTNTPTVTTVADPFGGSIGGVPLNIASGQVTKFVVNGLNLTAGGWNLNPVYLWRAANPNKNRLVIFNGGHQDTCDWTAAASHYNMQVNLRRFLAAGYSVLGMNQPGVGAGCTGMSPAHIAMGQALGSQMLIAFIEPNNQIINWLEANAPFDDYNMTGISGGGYETDLYGALDTRIHVAIGVASGIPGLQFIPGGYAGLNHVDCNTSGCWGEAQVAPFYTIAGYMDQAVMSGYGTTPKGRPHLFQHILNVYDACCWGDGQWSAGGFNYQTYFSVGGGGAAQCGNVTTCDWTTYLAYYSQAVATKVAALGTGTALPTLIDWVANYHQTSNCDADSFTATGGAGSDAGTPQVWPSCIGNNATKVGGYRDAITYIIATLDANPPTLTTVYLPPGGKTAWR
jgi:hypothetical protein